MICLLFFVIGIWPWICTDSSHRSTQILQTWNQQLEVNVEKDKAEGTWNHSSLIVHSCISI